MEALKKESLFVPPLPTLWPSMLFAAPRRTDYLPFASPSARYFYFCRNAVWLAVKMLNLAGHEVVVPAYHHGVEIEALIDAGAIPRFYRVGARWDVDLADVERQITANTRALYLIHYAGFPGPTEAMRALADQHGVSLLEDCALSLLSSDGDQPLGSTGEVAFFCLYKTLPVPNGGAMVINGAKRYSVPEPPPPPWTSTLSHTASSLLQNLELRGGRIGGWVRGAIRSLGRNTVRAAQIDRVATGTQHFDRAHVDLGMSPLTRKLALSEDLHAVVEHRRRNYFLLLGALRSVSAPLFSELPPGVCPLFYPLVVEDKGEVMARLRAMGVETVDFWRYFHPACDASKFPEVAQLRRTVLEIPCHQDLTPDVMARIAGAVKRALATDRPPQTRAQG